MSELTSYVCHSTVACFGRSRTITPQSHSATDAVLLNSTLAARPALRPYRCCRTLAQSGRPVLPASPPQGACGGSRLSRPRRPALATDPRTRFRGAHVLRVTLQYPHQLSDGHGFPPVWDRLFTSVHRHGAVFQERRPAHDIDYANHRLPAVGIGETQVLSKGEVNGLRLSLVDGDVGGI